MQESGENRVKNKQYLVILAEIFTYSWIPLWKGTVGIAWGQFSTTHIKATNAVLRVKAQIRVGMLIQDVCGNSHRAFGLATMGLFPFKIKSLELLW